MVAFRNGMRLLKAQLLGPGPPGAPPPPKASPAAELLATRVPGAPGTADPQSEKLTMVFF